MNETRELARLCQAVGSDVTMVQGGGGNGSIKSDDGETMWIKASGFRMSDVTPSHGFAKVSVPAVNQITRDPALASMSKELAHVDCVRRTNDLASGGPRPSMETGFHALLGRVVLHTHCVPINAFACAHGGEGMLRAAIDEPFLWMPYTTPGYVLSGAMDASLASNPQVSAIVLANHGFIANSDTTEGAIETAKRFVDASKSVFGNLPDDSVGRSTPDIALAEWADGLAGALRVAGSNIGIRASTSSILQRFAHAVPHHFLEGCLIPDDAIYTGLNSYVIGKSTAIPRWVLETGAASLPRFVVVIRGLGVVLGSPQNGLDALEESLIAYAIVRELIGRVGRCSHIPDSDCRYLLSMESEKYRQSVAARDSSDNS